MSMKVNNPRIYPIIVWLMLIFPVEIAASVNIDSLKQKINTRKADTNLYKIYYSLTDEYMNAELDSALYYSQLSQEVARQLNDSKRLGKAMTNSGIIYIMMNNSDKAFECFSESLELYKSIGDPELIGEALNNLGIYYNQMNQLPASLEHYLDALNHFELSGNIRKQALACNNIGIIFYDQKEYDNALHYYQKALNMLTGIDNDEGIAIASNNVGNVYFQNKSYDTALLFYNQSYNSEMKRMSLYGIAHELNKIGEVYFELKNYRVALDTLSKSLKIRREINIEPGISETSLAIGKIYLALNELDIAEKYCLEAYNLAVKINSEFWINAASGSLALIYEKKQKYHEALLFHKIFKSTSDSLVKAQNIKESTQIEMKYEFKQQQLADSLTHKAAISRQRKILNIFLIIIGLVILLSVFIYNRYRIKKKMNILLEQKNKLISEHEEQLKEAIATKDKFFSIIAHDLISPFNSILGFTQILCNEYDEYDEESRRKIIGNLAITSENTLSLLQNLLAWSRSQQGKIKLTKARLNLYELVDQSLSGYLGAANLKNIRVSNNIDAGSFVFADADTMRTVFGNIISNGIKFTRFGGTISIGAVLIHDMVEISFRDTGVGMEKSIMDNLFKVDKFISTTGTENEQGTGLGLIICEEFVVKNNGKIWVESVPDGVSGEKGSIFKISLPSNPINNNSD